MSSHSMLGAYGSWAATLAGEGPNFLSFRHTHWIDPAAWRPAARQRFRERVAMPDTEGAGECRIESQYEYDGLQVEELSWQLPYGPRTEAVLLKPAGARGRAVRCPVCWLCTITAAISFTAGRRSRGRTVNRMRSTSTIRRALTAARLGPIVSPSGGMRSWCLRFRKPPRPHRGFTCGDSRQHGRKRVG